MSYPNPFTNPEFYQTVKIGGRLIKASLVAIDGVRIEDEWSEQKATGTSGATNVFKGTKSPDAPTLTFEAVDETEFDDLRELWEMLAPKPGAVSSAGGATAGSPGSAAYGKQFVKASSPASATVDTGGGVEALLAQAQSALAALQSGASATATAAGASSSSSSSSSAVTSPGPKPPTLSIENGYVNYIGITAISRKVWEGPIATATCSFQVKLTVVAQKEPVKAAVGVSAPKSPDNPGQKTIAFGDIDGPAATAAVVNAQAAAAASE